MDVRGGSGPGRPRSPEVTAPLADPLPSPQSKAAASATREWTEQETLLLLEVIGARERGLAADGRCRRTLSGPRGLALSLSFLMLVVPALGNSSRPEIWATSFLSATWKFLLDPAEHTNTTNREL